MTSLKKIATAPVRWFLRKMPNSRAKLKSLSLFIYDARRFAKYAGAFNHNSREAQLAELIMSYHKIEKGLTMPRKRLNFGHDLLLYVIRLVEEFEQQFGCDDLQCRQAAGCVRAYLALHQESNYDFSQDKDYWNKIISFDCNHQQCPIVYQNHCTIQEFFAQNEAPFPAFAHSRHTLRHYSGQVDIETIRKSVELAMTAPSACNRQHVRVHCVSNHELRNAIYMLQNGNRGFGEDADKLLVVTADLADICWDEERHDAYTNAGIFTMNLCYALHYYKVAHCIMNWSVTPDADVRARKLLTLPKSQEIVLLIACGKPMNEVEIAVSRRKEVVDIFEEHR